MGTFAILLLSLITLITLIAAFLFLRAYFPARVDQVRGALEAHWKRAFWLGLVNTLFILALLLGLFTLSEESNPFFFIPAFALAGLFLIVFLFGLAAQAQLLGLRLFPQRKPAAQDILGGMILILTAYVPLLGWFLLLPYVIFLGVGAVVLAVFPRQESPEEEKDPAD